ncbi:MAG: PEGA domain-containing protein [Patescibacteria group bacterium]|nr:PEGA domain-containing protein [Patescibacteria group bacterium]
MDKKIRLILLIVFILLFVSISAVTLIYSFGYTLSNGLRLQKSGMFDIKTTPRGAQILLNGKPYQSFLEKINPSTKNNFATSPVKISGLTPGEYTVAIKLNGYHNWEKKLFINPGETTYLENVRLFPQESPKELYQINNQNIISVALSLDKKRMAILTESSVVIIDLKTQAVKQIDFDATNDSKKLLWGNNDSLLIAGNNLIEINSDFKIKKLPSAIKKEQFSLSSDYDNNIYYWDQNIFYIKNISKESAAEEKIIVGQDLAISDVLIKNNRFYLLAKNKQSNKTSLIISDIKDKKTSSSVDLPAISDYSFINQDNTWINIKDEKNKIAYLIEEPRLFSNEFKIKKIENYQLGAWLKDKKMLIAGDFDLKIWSRNDDTENLLTRTSQPIIYTAWSNDDNYILYSTNKTVYSFELDNRDSHSQIELINMFSLKVTETSPDGKMLYFVGKQSDKDNYKIYSLKIID